MGFLRDLVVRIKGDKTQLDTTLKGAGQSVNTFSSTVAKIGGVIAAAFSVASIINFTKESIKLAATAEGIRKGFEQIGSVKLLNDLQKATKGTVSDMQLMSRAVQASNFQIPLEDLSKLLAFASARAVQTGQSVDYLVDSIVLGIGRKSPLILDNLGISAVRLRQLLKGPGVEMASVGAIAQAVGKIATEEMEKMGGMAETMGVKFERFTASVTNLKVAWGSFLNNSKVINDVVGGAALTFKKFADPELNFWQKTMFSGKKYIAWLESEEVVKALQQPGIDRLAGKPDNKIEPSVIVPEETIEQLKDKLKKGEDAIDKFKASEVELIVAQQKANQVLRDQIAELTKLPPSAKEAEEALKKLKEENKAYFAETEQLNKAPQVNVTKSVFEEKIFSVVNKTSEELAPAPKSSLGIYKGIDMDQALKDMKVAQLEADQIMTDNEMRAQLFKDNMAQVINELQYMVADFAVEFADSIGQALGGANASEIGKDLLFSLANFIGQFGKLLVVTGLGMKGFDQALKNMDWKTAVIAGTAMIVASGALKGLMSAGAGGSSGGGGGASYASAGTSQMSVKVELEGVIKGKDIELVRRRYIEDNK